MDARCSKDTASAKSPFHGDFFRPRCGGRKLTAPRDELQANVSRVPVARVYPVIGLKFRVHGGVVRLQRGALLKKDL